MAQHIEQSDLVGTTVARRSTEAHESVFSQPPTSAANDNVREGSSPLVTFPEGLTGFPRGQQEPIRRHPKETDWPAFLRERIESPPPLQERFFSSWKMTLYVATVSIVEFGWLYLLWLALIRSVQWTLS
jgi:hypothetical protein